MANKAQTSRDDVEALYAQSPQPHQHTMRAMRSMILTIVPDAEETISYGMPAFRLDGTILCGLKAATHHVGYYPFSGSILQLFPHELQNYSHTKSAIHVPVDKPLSKEFLTKLIAARRQQATAT